jgi:ABC-type bacteriocin/lantibiotic exporter with double-glycine peptidase domain
MLYDAISQGWGPDRLLIEEADWARKFSETPPAPSFSNPLNVKFFSQNDNASGQGSRECFSSSCAMVANYWGKIDSDDAYNKVRARYGDTTDAQAQLSALRSLGLTANFFTTWNKARLVEQINMGRPIAVGWLHHGSFQNPSGGGHWTVVVGYTSSATIHNDPNGVPNLVSGNYTADLNGKALNFADQHWLPRFEVDGPSTGWVLLAHP